MSEEIGMDMTDEVIVRKVETKKLIPGYDKFDDFIKVSRVVWLCSNLNNITKYSSSFLSKTIEAFIFVFIACQRSVVF